MSTDSRVGSEIAGYRIESVLGRGGMGVVYVARHLRLDRTVALKVVSPELAEDPKFRDRFVRESRLAASLEHPSIVPIYDAGESGDLLYLAMRLIQGRDLKAITSEEALPPARALRILEQVGAALDAAHTAGLVHRDVKPGNVLVASPGAPGEHAYLSDFGLTKRMTSDSGLTGTGQFVGTLDYAAPEQFEGKQLDGRADVYSLACVLFECLTGDIPYRRDNQAALVYAHLMAEPPKVTEIKPELPEAIDQVVAKGMAKRPEDRYPTAGALVADARHALDDTGTGIITPPVASSAPPTRSHRPVATPARIATAALLVIAIVVGAVLLLNKGGGDGTGASPKTSATGGATAAILGKDRVVRIDPATRRITASIPVGDSPVGIVVAEGSIWTANSGANTVSRIDPVSNKVTSIQVGKSPSGLAFDNGSIWVVNALSNSVSEIDPGTNLVVATIQGEDGVSTIAAGDGVLLLGTKAQTSNFPPRTPVLLVDESSKEKIGRILVPGICPAFVSVDDGVGWAASSAGTLQKLDPHTGELIKQTDLGSPVSGLTIGDGAIWTGTDGLPAQVRSIDPQSLAVSATIPVGTTQNRSGASCDPISIVTGGQFVWVTNADDGTVSQIATGSNVVANIVDVGKRPTGLALGFNSLWVTVDPP